MADDAVDSLRVVRAWKKKVHHEHVDAQVQSRGDFFSKRLKMPLRSLLAEDKISKSATSRWPVTCRTAKVRRRARAVGSRVWRRRSRPSEGGGPPCSVN